MSMTSQKTRSSIQQAQKNLIQSGNWSKTFPAKIETQTKSCVFVKKLLTVSISNITYLRSMFPEDAYANRSMDGLPLKILREKNKCEDAGTLARWLVGAFEALEKNYLKELLLIIYLDSACPDKVYEMYSFKFSYPGGQVSCQVLQGEEMKEVQAVHPNDVYRSTQQLLRSIIQLTQGLKPLPSSAFLSMKLTYYDEVTPEDYEPVGFGPAEHEEVQMPSGSFQLGAGAVSTGHHTVKLRVQARQVEEMSREQHTIVANTFSASASESDSDLRVAQVGLAGDTVPLISNIISCICQNDMPDPLMLLCLYCSKQQHAACYRLTEEGKLPVIHCCVSCVTVDRACTDPKLVKIASKPAVVLTCIFRRVLVYLLKMNNVRVEFFMKKFGLSRDITAGIMTKLDNEDIIISSDGKDNFKVDKRTLEMVALPKYLGVKKTEERMMESILEKAAEMEIGDEHKKSIKRQREVGNKGSSDGREEESGETRRSKRIKRSKAEDFVKLSKDI